MLITIFSNSQIPILFGILILILFFLAYSKPWGELAPISRKAGYVLSVIVLLGIFFRFAQPLGHYIFFDEDYYLSSARTISLGSFHVSDFFLKKTGYELLLAIIFFIFGKSASFLAFGFNLALGILSIPLVYLLTRQLWSDNAAVASALFLAILPEHIRWSSTSSLEAPAIFFALCSLLVFLIFLKSRNWHHLVLSLLFAIYVSFIRPEMIAVALFEIVYILFDAKLLVLVWKNLHNKILTGVVLILFIWSSMLALLSTNTWGILWSGTHNIQTFFSLNYFFSNIWDIANYNFQTQNFLFFILIVAWIFGASQTLKKNNFQKPHLFIALFSFALFCYYNSFFAGGYSLGNTVHSRFAAIWLAFFVIIAGIGLDLLLQKINKKNSFNMLIFLFIFLSIYLQLNFAKFFPGTSQKWAEVESQAVVAFANENQNCVYLAMHPSPLDFRGYRTDYAQNFDQLKNDPKKLLPCMMFWESASCKYEDREVCESVLANPFWKKLSYTPVNIWQYSADKEYVASIPDFNFLPPKSFFGLLKSNLHE